MLGDIIIVDRGFRDCEVFLVNRGFIVKMPTCKADEKLSTKDANESIGYKSSLQCGTSKWCYENYFQDFFEYG